MQHYTVELRFRKQHARPINLLAPNGFAAVQMAMTHAKAILPETDNLDGIDVWPESRADFRQRHHLDVAPAEVVSQHQVGA